jgi:hypothetical protein
MNPQFTPSEAQTIARVMCALERQISIAFSEDRRDDALSLAELPLRPRGRVRHVRGSRMAADGWLEDHRRHCGSRGLEL